MTPQEIEALRIEALKDKVEALSDMVEILKAERDALEAQVARLEKKIAAINDGIDEYKAMSNDATADLVHKALMDVREEIIQRDLYQSVPDFIERFASEYAAKVRQGGEE